MVEFIETEEPIVEAQIADVESRLGLRFPRQYREHLMKYNGGRCDPNRFKFLEAGQIGESCVDWFLAIYDGQDDNLVVYSEIYKIESNRLPSHILPIAHDPGGNLICISCGSNDNGAIYFWDHERELDSEFGNEQSMLYFIAQSFDEFLVVLY